MKLNLVCCFFCLFVNVLLINASETIIQRNVDFLKVDINTLLTKWTKKFDSIKTYNGYVSCWRNATDTGSFMNTRHLTKALDKLKKEAEIELLFYRKIINKLRKMFPEEILMLNQRSPEVPYQSEDMKRALTDILVPFSDLHGHDLSQRIPMDCPYEIPDLRKWTLTSRVESCPPYDYCNIGKFTVLPNGNIVTIEDKFVDIFTMNGTRVKRFKSDLPDIYYEGITYWKNDKILVLHVTDDEDGEIYAIDLVLETTVLHDSAFPYDSYSGISVFNDVIFTCSHNGILFVMHRPYRVSRGRMYQYEPSYYEGMYLYKSGPGSEYGLLKGKFFHHQYVLIKTTGETVCSPEVHQYPTYMARAAVGKNFFVIGTYNFVGFQAYDLSCNPIGEPVRFHPNYGIIDMDIVDNTLIVRASDDDYNRNLFIYTLKESHGARQIMTA